MSDIDALDRSRRRMLIGLLAGFGVWQAAGIASELLSRGALPRWASLLSIALSLAGWLYWSVNIVRMLKWIHRVRASAGAADALNDERIRDARLRAFSFALALVLAAQLVPLFAPISARVGAQLTILVGCVAAIGAFLILERE